MMLQEIKSVYVGMFCCMAVFISFSSCGQATKDSTKKGAQGIDHINELKIDGATGIAEGPFEPTFESLAKFECPEWFRDAKFGLWAHWGAQSMTTGGDWYAQGLYGWKKDTVNNIQPSEYYPAVPHGRRIDRHTEKYGHPSQVGYTKLLDMWTAEKFTQEYVNGLLELYKKAGAKYFMTMVNHHDNFDLWDSKHHEWNSMRKGPKKNMTRIWQNAAQKAGLKFGVTSHLWRSYDLWGRPSGDKKWEDLWIEYMPQRKEPVLKNREKGLQWPGHDAWFGIAHQSDPRPGPYQGVPFDGADPKNWELFHDYENPEKYDWPKRWYNRMIDVIDQHRPDLFYLDHQGFMFWEQEYGRKVFAHFFNQGLQKYNGKQEVVLQLKAKFDPKKDMKGMAIVDEEAGVLDHILPEPWQTDISLGGWWWDKDSRLKTSNWVIDMLIDIVSKNGNLLLNIPNHPDGHISDKSVTTLKEIGAWIAVNGEGIYATRPFNVFGEGPMYEATRKGEKAMEAVVDESGNVVKYRKRKIGAEDIRFTQSKDGKTLFAFIMGAYDNTVDLKIRSVSKFKDIASVRSVELLGVEKPLVWKVSDSDLVVGLPQKYPFEQANCLKIQFEQ